jgi:hypothetical protein
VDEFGQLVSTMSRFTDAERAEILRQARETLGRRDEPPAPRATAPEPPPLVIETREERWRREANEDIVQREAADAERRRQAEADERRRGADWWALINRHIDERFAEQQERFNDLARAAAEFSDTVAQSLDRLDALCAQLNTKFVELRALDDQRRGIIDVPDFIRKERRIN